MNSPIKTNQLRVTIDHPSFDERYDIFAVTTSAQHFKHGAHILDVPLLENRVCAVRFLRGNTFYVMMEHAAGNLEVLKSVLQQDKTSDKLTLAKVKSTDLHSDTIIQLLLNNLGSAKSDFLRFNNITGQLYCFHPQWMKHSKKNGQDIIMKVPCLKLNITQQLRLEATVHTFTSILLKNKIKFTKRKFEEYPEYVLSVHHTLRRKLDNDNELAYIERQTENDRTEIPFIDFQSLARFEQSKMGVLWRIVSEFNEQYCGTAQISFDETTSYTALEYDRHASKEDKQTVREALTMSSVRLVDTIGDAYSNAFCEALSEKFSSRYGISVPIGQKVLKGHLNVRVIHHKEYYEGGKDPHDDTFDAAVQHITLEDFSDNCDTAISVIVHELLIKEDLQRRSISLFNWKMLNYENDWTFGVATDEDPKRYFFMTIHPDGSFIIEEQTLNLFEQSQYDECVAIFENEKRSYEQVKGIVRDGFGKINVIRDTGWYTIPQIDEIQEQLSYGNTYLRGKEIRNELLSACLDIKYVPGEACGHYFVGTIGNGMRANVTRASNIRRIEPYGDASIFFDRLLPLMNVSFVRNGQLTVVPFPFKYLREYVSQIKKNQEA